MSWPWLERRARRYRARPTLEHALLTNRAWLYFFYRFKFLAIRLGLRTVLHFLEVFLFAQVFSLDLLAPVLIFRTSTMAAGGIWWGALEQLRARVRQAARARQWQQARMVIDTWLLIAAACAAILGLAVLVWLMWGPMAGARFSVFDAFGLACVLRLALDLVVRTYHNGIFALRRVYRPLWSLLVVDFLDVAVVLVLWPWLGLWGFALAHLGVGFLRAGIAFLFARRAYSSSRIPRLRWRRLATHRDALRIGELRAAGMHALAYASSQVDAILILVLLASQGTATLPLAVLFYALSPLIAAGARWTRLFYFDFKRLHLGFSRLFRQRFHRLLELLAWGWGGGLALLVLSAAIFLRGGQFAWPLLVLVPFLVSRSLFALYLTQAFSYGRYVALVRASVAIGAGLLLLSFSPDQTLLMAGATLLLLVAVRVGSYNLEREDLPTTGLVNLTRWCALLVERSGPTQLGSLVIDRALASPARSTRELAAAFPERAFARWGRNHLLWFADTDATNDDLLLASAGCIRDLTVSTGSDGRALLRRAITDGWLGERMRLVAAQAPPPDTGAALAREFREQFPGGFVLDMHGGTIEHGAGMTSDALRSILRQVNRQSASTSDDYSVSAYAPGGDPVLVFAVDEHTVAARSWARTVRQASLRDSLG